MNGLIAIFCTLAALFCLFMAVMAAINTWGKFRVKRLFIGGPYDGRAVYIFRSFRSYVIYGEGMYFLHKKQFYWNAGRDKYPLLWQAPVYYDMSIQIEKAIKEAEAIHAGHLAAKTIDRLLKGL